mgnify:CR=1 FL=1
MRMPCRRSRLYVIASWLLRPPLCWSLAGPDVISLTMTPVMIIYSSLFARWAWVVKPRNLLLMGYVFALLSLPRRGAGLPSAL